MRQRVLIAVYVAILSLLLTTAAAAQKKSLTWLQGTWEGTGYQIDSQSTWTMRLTAKGRRFSIDYPSLNCGGTWKLITMNAYRARFKEVINYGKEECALNGSVVLQWLNKNQAMYLYSNAGTREISASSVLKRTRSKTPP
jgi:hypothetical protein